MLINLTPHEITIVLPNRTLSVLPSGTLARVTVTRALVAELSVDGVRIPVSRSAFGTVEGLPEPASGVAYIVSRLVAEACPDRTDLFFPDDTIRDAEGRITGCRALGTVHAPSAAASDASPAPAEGELRKVADIDNSAAKAKVARYLRGQLTQYRAERMIEAALGAPEAAFTEDERFALAGLLSGVPDGPRTLNVRVRVSAAEKDEMLALAAAEGRTISQLLRQRLGLGTTKD